jgi:hypothetical protein
MKRARELVPLSREHHEALVLARRACDPARALAEPVALREHLLRRWREHFEPHFRREEDVLLPALQAAGAAEAAREALSQHAVLRDAIERIRAGDLAALPDWGAAMHDHVKWEERTLFPLAERVLDLARLARGLEA